MLSCLLKIRTEVYILTNTELQTALPMLLGIDNEIKGLINVEYN